MIVQYSSNTCTRKVGHDKVGHLDLSPSYLHERGRLRGSRNGTHKPAHRTAEPPSCGREFAVCNPGKKLLLQGRCMENQTQASISAAERRSQPCPRFTAATWHAAQPGRGFTSGPRHIRRASRGFLRHGRLPRAARGWASPDYGGSSVGPRPRP
jgi:hypothetical protein